MTRTGISRRNLLVGGGVLAGALWLGEPAFGAAPVGTVWHPAVRAGYRFLDTAMDVHYPAYGELRLPQSYTDEAGLFGSAYTSDAALAALAYLAEGSDASTARAKTIGDSLRYAQEHDPAYRDGRLRESYTVGPYTRNGVVQPDGFVQPDGGLVNSGNVFDHSASTTGDQAWAGLALLALARRGQGAAYGTAAARLGEWIVTNCSTDQPLGGFRAGVGRAGDVLSRTDTGHNAVLVAFFDQLAASTGAKVWTERRAKAAAFVAAMWQSSGGYYATGSYDGVLPAPFPVTTEAQTLPVLALRADAQRTSLDYVTSTLTTTDTAGSANSALAATTTATGVTFSDWSRLANPDQPIEPGLSAPDPDAVWYAGSAQLAAALLSRGAPGDRDAAFVQLSRLVDAQTRFVGGKTGGGKPVATGEGIVAASSPLHAGASDFGYYPYRHVGTTAWYLLAATGRNPLAPARTRV
ncbi:Tat pathway signal sequence domain protein [Cryptosporangium sp. NPDC048952]|uniref:Tat pathway signal sequence domain protein n=1 Tax=Cryptosporangium sp. NPDC048952 TaxID=3363961 RepID=UPI003711416C